MSRKSLLSQFTNSVCLIGTKEKEDVNFMTVAWITQVSSQPPLLSISVSKKSYTCKLLKNTNTFSVNILNYKGEEIALKCGSVSGYKKDKSEYISYFLTKSSTPVIKFSFPGINGWMECEIFKKIETGDHLTCIGKIITVGEADSMKYPLVYSKRKIKTFKN